jgi:wobble nucleotide-excising tRNase
MSYKIKKILSLQGIGKLDISGNRSEFAEINVIYAENGLGKSSISQCFGLMNHINSELYSGYLKPKSEHNNSFQIICSNANEAQNPKREFVNLSAKEEYSSLPVFVFDEAFVDSNVYSGFDNSKKHKRNTYSLILGQKNTERQKNIEEQEATLNSVNNTLRTTELSLPELIREHISKKDDITQEYFQNLSKTEIENAQELNSELKKLESQNTQKQNFEKQISQIKLLDSPQQNELDSILNSTPLHTISQDMLSRADSSNVHEKSAWLEKGIQHYHKDSSQCPFCNQSIQESTKSWLDALDTYLSKEFTSIKNSATQLRNKLQIQKTKIEQSSTSNNLVIDALNNGLKPILEIKSSLNFELVSTAIESAINMLDEKVENPFSKDYDITHYLSLCSEIKDYNDSLDKTRQAFSGLLDKSNQDQIDALKKKIKQSELKQQIIDNWQEIEKYFQKQDEVGKLKKDIQSLKRQQKQALEELKEQKLQDINHLLSNLYPAFPEIKAVQRSQAGEEPALELQVQFPEKKGICLKDGLKALSESQKNAIALALFLNDVADKKDAIIVFDDPVNSFDQIRIDETLNLIVKISTNASQVFIMIHDVQILHYLHYKKLKTLKNKSQFFKLERNEHDKVDSIQRFERQDIIELINQTYSPYYYRYEILKRFEKSGKWTHKEEQFESVLRCTIEDYIQLIHSLAYRQNGYAESFVSEWFNGRHPQYIQEGSRKLLKELYDYAGQTLHNGCRGMSLSNNDKQCKVRQLSQIIDEQIVRV